MTLPGWTDESVHFADDQHRLWLRRRLSVAGHQMGDVLTPGQRPFVVIGHNPSIAAGTGFEDPTSRRCIGFAHAYGATDLVMVNAATGVATDANNLWAHCNQPFLEALETIKVAAEFAGTNGILVAAWGAPKGGRSYNREHMLIQYRRIKELHLPLHVLRLTKNGFPEHPLYLPKELRPQPWSYTT